MAFWALTILLIDMTNYPDNKQVWESKGFIWLILSDHYHHTVGYCSVSDSPS